MEDGQEASFVCGREGGRGTCVSYMRKERVRWWIGFSGRRGGRRRLVKVWREEGKCNERKRAGRCVSGEEGKCGRGGERGCGLRVSTTVDVMGLNEAMMLGWGGGCILYNSRCGCLFSKPFFVFLAQAWDNQMSRSFTLSLTFGTIPSSFSS